MTKECNCEQPIFDTDKAFNPDEWAGYSNRQLAEKCHRRDMLINRSINRQMGLNEMYHEQAVLNVKKDTRIKELEGALSKQLQALEGLNRHIKEKSPALSVMLPDMISLIKPLLGDSDE